MIRLLLAACFALVLTACASQLQMPYQYATLKAIESDRVTADQVIDGADKITALLTERPALTSSEITDAVRRAVGYSDLDPSDRLLVDALLSDAMASLPHDVDTEPGSHIALGQDSYVLLLQRLEWIAQAAALAE